MKRPESGDVGFVLILAAWLWPIPLALVEALAWFFFGSQTGLVDWTDGRVIFAITWVVAPPLVSLTWMCA